MLICADARRIPLPDESMQCVVTSPPYWGLRKYKGEQELIWLPPDHPKGSDFPAMCAHEWRSATKRGITGGMNQGNKNENPDGATNRPVEDSAHGTCSRCGAWRGAYGLEPTVEMYVAHTVEILREIRRVLRKDGVVFWNIGDSYAGSWGNYSAQNRGHGKQREIVSGSRVNNLAYDSDSTQWLPPTARRENGLKPKDLCLIPERVALAAQADGWWVRSRIIWAKPNPMPESVGDRPTDAIEHVWMFAKSERYFFDAEAVREPADPASERRSTLHGDKNLERQSNGDFSDKAFSSGYTGHRNLRNVWTFPTQPYSGAHFATFPEELPRRCIKAATSARGACAQCGAPWQRIVEPSPEYAEFLGTRLGNRDDVELSEGKANGFGEPRINSEYITVGWKPTCECGVDETVPCLTLDPFGGSGTTARVAIKLNRRAVLLDLAYHSPDGASAEYAALARERIANVQREMFA